MIRLRFLVLLGCFALGTPHLCHARTEGGDLLWQVILDLSDGPNRPGQLAAAGGRVVVVGTAQAATGQAVFVVRAYEARTGAVLWTDRTNGSASFVVMDDQRVIAAGGTTDAAGAPQVLIRAFHAKTGNLLWKDRRPDSGTSLALDGQRLVVAGTIQDGAARQLLVRGYGVKTGEIEWEHRSFATGYPSIFVPARGLTLRGNRAFVAAVVAPLFPDGLGGGSGTGCLVRAFDARRGAVLWDEVARPSAECIPTEVATDGRRVVLGATGGTAPEQNFLVHAYDAASGAPLWQYRSTFFTGLANLLTAVDVARGQAIIAGWDNSAPDTTPGFKEAFIIRSFDVETGAVRWEDVFSLDESGFFLWHALDLDIERGRVFAVGQDVGRGTWFVRSYHAPDGTLVWHDEFQPPGMGADYSWTQAVAVDGGRIFVAGRGFNASGTVDLILRAYDSK